MTAVRQRRSGKGKENVPPDYTGDTAEVMFHRAMVSIHEHILRERRYNANRYIQLLSARGGVVTAKDLLNTPGFQTGFAGLWEKSPVEKTIEYLVLLPFFACLFTEEEKKTALSRLRDCGYPVD